MKKKSAYIGIGIELILLGVWVFCWNFHCEPIDDVWRWWNLPWMLTNIVASASFVALGGVTIFKAFPDL